MSTIKADTLVASDGTSPATLTKQSAAKAWVHYNSSMSADDSFGISSIGDTAAGRADINFTSAFSNAHYTAVTGASNGAASSTTYNLDPNSFTTADVELRGKASGGGTVNLTDLSENTAAFHGDLA